MRGASARISLALATRPASSSGSAKPSQSPAVAAGSARVQGYFPFFTAANATITAANGSNPRIDLISYDYNGAVTVTAGTWATSRLNALKAGLLAVVTSMLPTT